MTLLSWLFYLIVGRIIVEVWMKFQLPKFLKKSDWFVKLHDCPLCSGVWIYSVMSFFMGVDLLVVTGFGYIPLVGAIITGVVVSWVVHLFSLGWKEMYGVVVV